MIRREGIDRSRVEKEWAARGFRGGLWIDPPGQVWSNYIHDNDEVLMVMEGGLEIEMQGKKVRLEVGEEVFIPAGVRHTLRNVGGSGAHWLYAYRL